MKRLFSTPKRAVISVVCIVVVIAAVCLMAVKSTLISKAEAKAVALKDAGLNETEASALRARLEFDDGRFQYDVDFYNNGITYEYSIQAKNGDIIARDIEGGANGEHYVQEQTLDAWNQSDVNENASAQSQEDAVNQSAEDINVSVQPSEESGAQLVADGNRTAQSQSISLDEAKAAALGDAGLPESDVTFKKAKLDYDDGIQVYDIEFYTSDTEYDYKINASDKTVIEKSIELFKNTTKSADNTTNSSGNNYIGVDRAKEIALNHANLNESDVQFTKAKLENDDGRVEYEIEFYYGRTEYEYTIDAVSGNINEYDVDYD